MQTGHPKKVGDTIKIGGKPFEIIGLYDTGSMILDVVMVMDIEIGSRRSQRAQGLSVLHLCRRRLILPRTRSFRVPSRRPIPGFDARSMKEAQANFGSMMGQVDSFLLMTVSLALVVGIVGIINTMLMSTTERFVEFGVLRTNGWSQGNILALVTLESAYLGLLAGVAGCLLAAIGTTVINQFLSRCGHSPGHDAVTPGAGNRPFGVDGNLRRPLSCLAGGAAFAHGCNQARVALTTFFTGEFSMIEVVNVYKSYRSGSRWVDALRGLSCRIEQGRFAFIVGPSGSGKSSLLYLLGATRSTHVRRDLRGWKRAGQDVPVHAEHISPRPDRFHFPVV